MAEFVVGVERKWKLWIAPVLAFLYFLWVVYLATTSTETAGVTIDTWVYIGAALFLVVLVIELFLLPRRKEKVAKQVVAEETATSVGSALPLGHTGEDEFKLTAEEFQGKRVVELSRPPKSTNSGAVYSKALVEIGDQWVLRIEDLVAGREDA
ncbi:MAG: hypothetical protein ACYDCK_04565 [Thermoplasmatota archaeon]